MWWNSTGVMQSTLAEPGGGQALHGGLCLLISTPNVDPLLQLGQVCSRTFSTHNDINCRFRDIAMAAVVAGISECGVFEQRPTSLCY